MLGSFSHVGYSLLFGIIPSLILLVIYKKLFLQSLSPTVKTLLIFLLLAPVVDSIALRNRIWFFSVEKGLGVNLLSIYPVDEFIFATVMGLLVCIFTIIFLDLERKQASLFTWLKTIVGISSLAIMTTVIMLFLRLTI